jgi:iron complex transport system ATP-binding protein
MPKDETSIRLFGEEQWNVWDVRKRLGIVSHDLQHHYMEKVTGLKVVLASNGEEFCRLIRRPASR